MTMRAAVSLYVHPDLTDSEVWPKSTLPSSSPSMARNAAYAALATVSLAVASTFAVLKFTGMGSPLIQQWL
ncbi:hypothetical protein AX17_007118 [Amanita inopinata Kibby_2008]|nr:hypothetical protein AX17_007118 [Amanita inopinata Kibby_2008]